MPGRPDRDVPHMAHRSEASVGSDGSAGSYRQTALSIREAAVRTGRSEAAIYHLIATGQLPAQPTASRGLSIHPTDLEKLERTRTGFRGSGWPSRSVQSLWEWIQQREQATARRLRTGMRSLLAGMSRGLPGPPWYWIMPWRFCRAALAPHC
jgi:predicted DNA-binding transcriptional regulator AlpA